MNGNNATLNEILATFTAISQHHAQINDIFIGTPDQIDQSTRQFPLVVVDVMPGRMFQFIEEWKFRIYIFDLEKEDNSNRYEIQSDARQILRDIVLALIYIYSLDAKWEALTTVFEEQLDSFCSGMYMDLAINVPNSNGVCDFPTKN